jgi:hypothetical protein
MTCNCDSSGAVFVCWESFHTYIRTHTYILTYIRTYVHTYINTHYSTVTHIHAFNESKKKQSQWQYDVTQVVKTEHLRWVQHKIIWILHIKSCLNTRNSSVTRSQLCSLAATQQFQSIEKWSIYTTSSAKWMHSTKLSTTSRSCQHDARLFASKWTISNSTRAHTKAAVSICLFLMLVYLIMLSHLLMLHPHNERKRVNGTWQNVKLNWKGWMWNRTGEHVKLNWKRCEIELGMMWNWSGSDVELNCEGCEIEQEKYVKLKWERCGTELGMMWNWSGKYVKLNWEWCETGVENMWHWTGKVMKWSISMWNWTGKDVKLNWEWCETEVEEMWNWTGKVVKSNRRSM